MYNDLYHARDAARIGPVMVVPYLRRQVVGPPDPQDVTRDIARDLTGVVGELAALKGDAANWLRDPEYEALRHRLEIAHAAAEAAVVEARRRVRLDEER